MQTDREALIADLIDVRYRVANSIGSDCWTAENPLWRDDVLLRLDAALSALGGAQAGEETGA
jgi:hypothetical protein